MCINKKVVGWLAFGGLAVYLAAPNLIGAALPLLILAVCPLSMIVMMRGMSRNGGSSCADDQQTRETDIDAELTNLRAEVARLRAERDPADTVDTRHAQN